MKKLSYSQKLHLLTRIRYAEKKKKRLKKASHYHSTHYNSLYNKSSLYRPPFRNVFEELPPKYFNLQYENCREVIKYINKIKKAAKRDWDIGINLKEVLDIKEGAIAMLLSVIKEISSGKSRTSVNGNMPLNINAKDVLAKSGFLKFVETPKGYKIPATKNVMRTGKKGNPSSYLGSDVRDAMNTVWGSKGRNPPLRSAIFEMIRNSCDHAFEDTKELFWHLSISHDEVNNSVKFSFVDNGSGILETMRKPLKDYLNFFKGDADMLETAFNGGIESRTKLPWRGKGLPAIYENYVDGYFKNLLVISNGVFIHFDKGIKSDLGIKFSGTYYYWEIDTSCEKICFEN